MVTGIKLEEDSTYPPSLYAPINGGTAPAEEPLEEGELTEDNDRDSIASSRGNINIEDGAPPSAAVPEKKVDPKVEVQPAKPSMSTEKATGTVVATPAIPAPELSQMQLDQAKSLVLDLLGWGVTPEYLVEYGVSSQVIYRVFTDLNLRLPANFSEPSLKKGS